MIVAAEPSFGTVMLAVALVALVVGFAGGVGWHFARGLVEWWDPFDAYEDEGDDA